MPVGAGGGDGAVSLAMSTRWCDYGFVVAECFDRFRAKGLKVLNVRASQVEGRLTDPTYGKVVQVPGIASRSVSRLGLGPEVGRRDPLMQDIFWRARRLTSPAREF
ncbi:hypothetical protein G7Y89_g7652 [Cudoniella acicularis]|uniref:Uncharacterized protein n=1 Tax=Cudoniella acicularis TaxID=354080 RepID=A0A8H4RKJ1_9HELO|nr:hypothetical protein G7Y89_g7652 [Cudoniella acicularis]